MTLVGLRYDKRTENATEFLLVDPHYRGADDNTSAIIKEGWCQWHKPSHFSASMFYNFCMPLIKK